MTHKTQKIGLFGFGTVGQGLYQVIDKAPNTNAEISKVVARDAAKTRTLGSEILSFNPDDIINDQEIDTVAELIDDADAAWEIVRLSLKKGKNVVSGNKKMIAEHLEQLLDLQKQTGKSLLYDASACGSIPVIRNLEEYYDNDLLVSITGILNGSSNYILTKMYESNSPYQVALKEAQEKGFAESDPSFDVDGFDSMYKLIILTLHAFGVIVKPDEFFYTGISSITSADIQYAKEKGYKIKLLAKAQKCDNNKLVLYVMPKFISNDKYIYNVDNEFNGVVIEGDAYDKQLMFGRGAGGFPTGSAVLSDITALKYNYKYEYKKFAYSHKPQLTNDHDIVVYFRYNKPELIDLIPVKDIYEQFTSKSYHYSIGLISLSDLLNSKDLLRKFDVFTAQIG